MDNIDATTVYRYYDVNNILLYVGVTSRGAKRNAEHFSKVWWKYVSRQEMAHYADRRTALAEERKLIASHQPPFNTQLNQSSDASRAAYLEFAGHHKSTGVDVIKHIGKRWYDCEVVERSDKLLRLVVNDPVAAYATPGKSMNIAGRSTQLVQCHAGRGKLHLVIARKSGEFPRSPRDVRVNMAIPPEGMRIKSIQWSETMRPHASGPKYPRAW